MWHQAIILGLLLNGSLETNLSEILIKIKRRFIHENVSENMVRELRGNFVQGEMSYKCV